MKVAVYTITKNEEQFIEKWADSAHEADSLIVADTGSTDRTVELAEMSGCVVYDLTISPWRFDDARNASLALIPADTDWCIALDADEVLVPGWREALEAVPAHVTRPTYHYTWSWNPNGSPGLTYGGDKIHRRHGYRWRHPVHETITPLGAEVRAWCDGLQIEHYPDNSKSRASYLPLLELAVREDPTDDRNAHYLAREYFYKGQFARAAHEFKRHLALPKATWPPERAKSMRLLAGCIPEERETWLLRAAAEDPNRREQWVALAQLYYERESWVQCYAAAMRAITINEQDLSYINEAEVWGALPYDLAAISAFRLGMQDEAIRWGLHAHLTEPHDERIAENLKWYRGEHAVE